MEMLPGVCGDPSKASTGAGAAVVYELLAKSFRGAASEAVPGSAVCPSSAAAAGTGLRRGVITGAMPACGCAPSRLPTRSCPRPGFGQSCTAITWSTRSFATPGCFQARTAPNHRAAVPLAEKFGEELWGRVNLKSWLKRAPNTSRRARGPCREIRSQQ